MNKSDIDILSITILNIQLPSNISWVVEGIVGLVGNALLFLVIAKTKNLKSNFYLCLMNIAIADSIFCFFLTYAGSQRLILTAKNLPATVSPIDCIPLFLPLATAKVVSPAQAVTIALDRFLCVAFPARYRHFEVKYLQLINLLMWAVPIVVMSYAGTFLNPASLIPLCTTGGAWLPVMNDISSFAGITLDLMTILLYGALALLLLFRIHVGRKNGQSLAELKKSMQFRAIQTSFMLLVVYTCVALTGEIYLLITNVVLDASQKMKFQPYTSNFLLLACFLTFVISVFRNRDIRTSMHDMISCRGLLGFGNKVTVQPQSTAGHNTTTGQK